MILFVLALPRFGATVYRSLRDKGTGRVASALVASRLTYLTAKELLR